MSVTNENAKFGACPYSDGSGYRFEVSAVNNTGEQRIVVKQHSDFEVWISPSEWPHLKTAIERALAFLDHPQDTGKG